MRGCLTDKIFFKIVFKYTATKKYFYISNSTELKRHYTFKLNQTLDAYILRKTITNRYVLRIILENIQHKFRFSKLSLTFHST